MYWNMRNIPLLQVTTLATNLRLNRPGNVLASETYKLNLAKLYAPGAAEHAIHARKLVS